MDLIQERIQAAIKPLEQRLDLITQQQKQLAEECLNLKQLLAKKDTKNLNTTITSVDRKRIMTVTSPSNRTASKPVSTAVRGLKNQITSPQAQKKIVNSRPVTALTKPKGEVKPLGPANTVKQTPVRSVKSPINQVFSNANKKVTIGKPTTPTEKSITSKPVKSESKSINQTKPQISQPIQVIKQQTLNTVQNSQKIKEKQHIQVAQQQSKSQKQQQKAILTQQHSIKKQSIVALPELSINQSQQPIASKIEKSEMQYKHQKINTLQTTIEQDTNPLHVDDLKLQNINSAFSVQQKTEKQIVKVQNLGCSILKQPDQVFNSFVENPTSTNDLTNQCLQEPGSDEVL